MRTFEEFQQKLEKYNGIEFLHCENLGNIAWHYSTGENIELLFIEAMPGHGESLLKSMVLRILDTQKKPYYSVFAFRLAANEKAKKFYDKLGWTQVELGQSIYAHDHTVIAWITWQDLLINLQI